MFEPEDAMSTTTYVPEESAKIGLRPSRKTIKRVALGLVAIIGAAVAADFGYDYVTTGRYLEATDNVLKKHGGLWFNDEAFVVTRRS